MVSGFHGNTDPVMVMFLFLAAVACARGGASCGILLAYPGCQIKIIPLLFVPIFFLFWLHRRQGIRFSRSLYSDESGIMGEPLAKFPALFVRNVLLYSGFWGNWE